MYNEISERAQNFATYIIEKKSTIRACAKHFSTAKSTVHYDLKYRLPYINKPLYEEVKEILNTNFEEKHLRGGEATRLHYLDLKEHSLNTDSHIL